MSDGSGVLEFPAPDVPEELLPTLNRLILGPHGSMWPMFQRCRHNRNAVGRVFIEPELKGWALRFKSFPSNQAREKWTLHTYVNPEFRRMGVGTLLVAAASRRLKYPMTVIHWDETSHGFYGAFPRQEKLRHAGHYANTYA